MEEVGRALATTPWELWDYSADSEIVLDHRLFSDRDHMNDLAAGKYSTKIAGHITAAGKADKVAADHGPVSRGSGAPSN